MNSCEETGKLYAPATQTANLAPTESTQIVYERQAKHTNKLLEN